MRSAVHARSMMVSDGEAELVTLFRESTPPMLELSEIEERFREKQRDCKSLQHQLQGLVDKDCIGCRKLPTGDDSERTPLIYWLKKEFPPFSATPVSAVKSSQGQSSLQRGGLKRTRPKFISPLLSQKKSKLELGDHRGSERSSSSTSSLSVGQSSLRARLDFTDAQGDSGQVEGRSSEVGEREETSLKSCVSEKKGDSGEGEGMEVLEKEKRTLTEKLKEREEKLRKLKLVKMYRTKNDLKELEQLTSKWRGVAQEAAEMLLGSSTYEPRPSMAEMLDYLHIDHELIRYSAPEESFY